MSDSGKPPGAEGSITVRKDPTGSNRIIIDIEDSNSPTPNPPPTIIRRWEAVVSILLFAISSAVQFELIPQGRASKIAMWAISVIAQIGIIFGRPLLIRGARQPIEGQR